MPETLDDALAAAGSPVALLRDSARRADTGPATGLEFSNWRDEQRSWRESAALFDLSHHMTDLNLAGPGAVALLSELCVNSLASFPVGKAKQLVVTDDAGHVIGDAIVDHMSAERINVAGSPPAINWIQFHAESGDHDVTWQREEPTATNPNHHPDLFRFQVNGPAAMEVLAAAHGGPLPDIPFFGAATLRIGGVPVRALGHNMSRAKGAEIQGPWADQARVREALLAAGAPSGLTPVGSKAPTPATLESGWLPNPIPAVYTGDGTKAFRQWLPAASFEGLSSLGGSFRSDDIEDYYFAPADIGYAKLVRFDHDFIGRDALEQRAAEPHRHKVTLEWNTEDVLRVMASQFAPGTPFKAFELPFSQYATFQFDTVLAGDRPVGVSTAVGYTYNERRMLSLAVVAPEVALGDEVTVVWGEPDGGKGKASVEQHVQTELRATVRGVPYSDVHYR